MKRSIISLTNTGAFAGIVLVNAAGTSVQLRQTITGDGLVVTSGNGHNDQFIAMPSRVLAGRDQVRTVLMPVPAGTTAAEAQAAVDGFNATGGCLWFRTSDDVSDILGANQLAGIASGKSSKSLSQYEHDLRLPTAVGEDGAVTYSETDFRGTFFSRVPKDDADLRVAALKVGSAAQLAQSPVAAPVAAVPALEPPF